MASFTRSAKADENCVAMIVDDKSSNENCEAEKESGGKQIRSVKVAAEVAEKISIQKSVAEIEGDRGTTFAPRPSVCATGHPSHSRTLGLAASDSFCRDRPALRHTTSLSLARAFAQ